jgi:2'-hydroxyisoflavone reductase
VLAPGDPADPLQFIDVRDLAAWLVDACHRDGRPGTFNVSGQPMSFKHLLDRCVSVTGSGAELAWVPTDALLARGADPWMGVPMWIAAAPGWAAAND